MAHRGCVSGAGKKGAKMDFSPHCVRIPLRLFFPKNDFFFFRRGNESDINNGLESLLVPLSYHFLSLPLSSATFSLLLALSNCQSKLLISSALFSVSNVPSGCEGSWIGKGKKRKPISAHFSDCLGLFLLRHWDGAIFLARLWGKLLVFSRLSLSVIP